jgi:hypothetical protein
MEFRVSLVTLVTRRGRRPLRTLKARMQGKTGPAFPQKIVFGRGFGSFRDSTKLSLCKEVALWELAFPPFLDVIAPHP